MSDLKMQKIVIVSAAMLATVVSTFVILMPAKMVPSSHFTNQDKVEHIAVTAILGGLWMMAGSRPFYVLLAGMNYAICTELLQKWMALGRTCDPMDALADMAGTVIGVVGVLAWNHHRRGRSKVL